MFDDLVTRWRDEAGVLRRRLETKPAALMEQMADELATVIAEGGIGEPAHDHPEENDEEPRGEVLLDHLYNARQTAEILGFASRPSTIYDISESELVPTWVGPRRGKKMFRGRDILAYLDRGRAP